MRSSAILRFPDGSVGFGDPHLTSIRAIPNEPFPKSPSGSLFSIDNCTIKTSLIAH